MRVCGMFVAREMQITRKMNLNGNSFAYVTSKNINFLLIFIKKKNIFFYQEEFFEVEFAISIELTIGKKNT